MVGIPSGRVQIWVCLFLFGWSLPRYKGVNLGDSKIKSTELKGKNSGARGPPQFLKKRSENAGANESLSGGFAAIPGIAPRVAPRILGSY